MSVGGANTRTVASGPVGPVCSVTVLLLRLRICFKEKPSKIAKLIVDLNHYSWEIFRTIAPPTLGPPHA